MANPRIDDLRRRVDNDPASIAFAQLAEEYRRSGEYQQAIDVARTGLDVHPGYLSARVTLARALLEIGASDEAQREFEIVLKSAPDNLAAIRGLADIHHRQTLLSDPHVPSGPGDIVDAAEQQPERPASPVAIAPAEAAPESPMPPSADSEWVDLSFAALDADDGDQPPNDPGVAALERFLTAIHVTRAERRP